jgi:hypothetical protein
MPFASPTLLYRRAGKESGGANSVRDQRPDIYPGNWLALDGMHFDGMPITVAILRS